MLGAVKREREQWHNENKSDKVEKISLSGLRMSKNLSFSTLTRLLNAASGILPEHRKGKNVTYSLQDAVLGAFSIFFMQSASFLAYQEEMQNHEGCNNAASLFGLKRIPSDNQIRNLLDLLEPSHLFSVFAEVTDLLEENGELQA